MLLLVIGTFPLWEVHTTSVATLALPSGTLLIVLAIACHASSDRLGSMATHAVGTGCVLVASAQFALGVKGFGLLGLLAVGVLLVLLSRQADRGADDAPQFSWVGTARAHFTLAGCWASIPLLAVEAHWPESSRLAAVAAYAASCAFAVGTLASSRGTREARRASAFAFALGIASLVVIIVDVASYRACVVSTVFECCPWTRSIRGSLRLPCDEPGVELHLVPLFAFTLACAVHVAIVLVRSSRGGEPAPNT